MSQRISLDKLEFYITNVCNMSCDGCNRYNNYHFKGWQDWKEYEPILAQWAEKIDIKHIIILGGEPLLNPTILDWFKGLRRLWPNHSGLQIQTNGTRIDAVEGLYEACDYDNWIGVSLHSKLDEEEVFEKIRKFLKWPIMETTEPKQSMGHYYEFTDSRWIKIRVWLNDHFVQSNIIEQPTGQFTLYQSDPEKAHNTCIFAQNKNYHMINGKIYKCGPVALMPEFDQQFQLNISDEDRQLLNSYRPLTIDEVDTRGEEFFNTIDNFIPQCKFCPESYEYKPITFGKWKKPVNPAAINNQNSCK